MTDILADTWQFLEQFWFVLTSTLGFSPGISEWMRDADRISPIVFLIVMMGGASLLLGQSVILFVNRVKPGRFGMSLVLNGVLLLANLYIWALIIWLVGLALFRDEPDYWLIARVVGLSYAPYLFGVFILMPYLGSFWHKVLEVWSFLIVLTAIRILYAVDWWAALVCVGLGWLLITFLTHTLGRPLVALRKWLIEWVAGTPLESTIRDILTFTPDVAAKAGIAGAPQNRDES